MFPIDGTEVNEAQWPLTAQVEANVTVSPPQHGTRRTRPIKLRPKTETSSTAIPETYTVTSLSLSTTLTCCPDTQVGNFLMTGPECSPPIDEDEFIPI